MENYKVEMTENTPGVELDANEHELTFEGDSRPEDVQKFYTPIIKWLDDYTNHLYFLKDKFSSEILINCSFKFEYFNSSSAKYVLDIMNKLSSINKESNKIKLKINWNFDEMDEDMFEAGKEFEDMLGFEFNFIAK